MLKYLLDTHIVVYTMKNRSAKIREAFNAHEERLRIPSMTLMELIYGAEKSNDPVRNTRAVETFAARLSILDYDLAAARHTGQIRTGLARNGQPMSLCDQMIAGHARSLGLIPVSNAIREFERIPGLCLENWVR